MTLFARLILVAAALPFVLAHDTPPSSPSSPNSGAKGCQKNEFFWEGGDCCVKSGGSGKTPSPPKGKSCPPIWEWDPSKSHCVPQQPPTGNPSCSSGWGWNLLGKCCEEQPSKPPSSTPSKPSSPPSKCDRGQFFWDDGSCCLDDGGSTKPPSPPKGTQCPHTWQWHSSKNWCVPTSPPPTGTPSCSSGWGWNKDKKCCTEKPTTPAQPSKPSTTPSKPSCGDKEFYWQDGNCCLHNGGNPNPPSPPKGTGCPRTWQWNADKKWCTPTAPPTGAPSCSSGYEWNQDKKCCDERPTSTRPSGPPTSTPSKPQCGKNEFSWNGICLPVGGAPKPPQPPKGTGCPPIWQWHTGQGCCVPTQPPPSGPPSCSSNYEWNPIKNCCDEKPTSTRPSTPPTLTPPKPQCGKHEFSWNGICLPVGGVPKPPQPPKGTGCPPIWQWHNGQGCCVPTQPPPSTPPTCSSGYEWNSVKKCCDEKPTSTRPSTPPTSTPPKPQCGKYEFSWNGVCLPVGGVPKPPQPPKGSNCPPIWQWHNGQGCCVPTQPPPSTPPTCSSGYEWNPIKKCCDEKPTSTRPSTPPTSTPPKPQCGKHEFSWNGVCLPVGGVPKPPQPPKGSSCPPIWQWHTGQGCCVPTQPPPSGPPTCSPGYGWNNDKQCCDQNPTSPTKPSTPSSTPGQCGDKEFFWFGGGCCVPTGGSGHPPKPPTGHWCPKNWEWDSGKRHCVPQYPPTGTPSCSTGGWNPTKKCCDNQPSTPTPPPSTPTAPGDCGSNYFFWPDKKYCLPHGGNPNPPKPPSGTSCPMNWNWHGPKRHCTPNHPNPPPPQCGNGWGWDKGSFCCHPGTTTPGHPTPSAKPHRPGNGPHYKRHAKTRAVSLCPAGLDPCPLPGLNGNLTDDWECTDTSSDLEACGGCVSTGAGQDCTAIPGAWNVGCNQGQCVVYTCASGFLRSLDNKSCIRVA